MGCTKFKVILLVSTSILISLSCAVLHGNLQNLASRTASVTTSDALNLSESNLKLQSRTSQEIVRCSTQNEGGILINILASKVSTSEKPITNTNDLSRANTNKSISATTKYAKKVTLFLLFPTDQSVQSVSSLEGMLESIVWIPLYFWLLYLFYYSFKRNKTGMKSEFLFAYLFIVAFIGFSVYTEVNFGTAIRHRSVLLLPIGFLTLAFMKGLKNNDS